MRATLPVVHFLLAAFLAFTGAPSQSQLDATEDVRAAMRQVALRVAEAVGGVPKAGMPSSPQRPSLAWGGSEHAIAAAGPTAWECAVLSREAYKNSGYCPPLGWSYVQSFADPSGFSAALFMHTGRQQLVFAIRGTDSPGDFIADLQLATGRWPNQATRAAIDFISVLNLTLPGRPYAGFTLHLTGHSLGAFLAETSWAVACWALYYTTPVITFESPGTYDLCNALLGTPQLPLRPEALPFTSYMGAPNFINAAKVHGGTIVRVYPKFTHDDASPDIVVEDFLRYSVQQHTLGDIECATRLGVNGLVAVFDAASGEPYVHSIQTAYWPTTSFCNTPNSACERYSTYEHSPHYWELLFDRYGMPRQERFQFIVTYLGGVTNSGLPGLTIHGDGHDNSMWGSTCRDDHLLGYAGSDVLYGYGGNDVLEGHEGSDFLFGGENPFAGAALGSNTGDVLDGGPGADSLDGGPGESDVVSYASASSGVTLDLSVGVGTRGDALGDQLINIEGIIGSDHADVLTGVSVTGGAGDDVIIAASQRSFGSGEDGADRLVGNIGDDRLIGGNGNDSITGDAGRDNLFGDAGDDVIFGGTGDDRLDGGPGRDTLAGDDGADNLVGGDDADTLTGGAARDFLDGGAGDDHLDGGLDRDTLHGGEGNDVLVGGDGDDQLLDGGGLNDLFGGGGNDTLIGGQDIDLLRGGSDNDQLTGGAGGDTLDGGDGRDMVLYVYSLSGVTINLATGQAAGGDAQGDLLQAIEDARGSALADALTGDSGDNTLTGDAGDDALAGGDGNDVLFGGNDQDSLVGDAGNDSLRGGSGDDVLEGGPGADGLQGDEGVQQGNDRFVIRSRSHSTDAARDSITDFQRGRDRIDLRGLGFSGIQAGQGSGSILGFTFQAGSTLIDDDGSDFSISLSGSISLTSADFIF